MPDTKTSFIEELHRLRRFAQDALKSGAYFYPFKGLFYFARHKNLQKPLYTRLWPTAAIGLGVTTSMFLFTYVPQVALLAFTSGPLAPISAIFLVLSESSTITNFLARSFLLREALVDTFDGTLVARGLEGLVKRGREVESSSSSSAAAGEKDPVARLGRFLKRPFEAAGSGIGFSPKKYLLRSLAYLPLNFIPVVGTVVYLVVQGGKVGPGVHDRYFQLKGWDAKRVEEWVARNRAAYTSFGAASFMLEMVPFVSLVFAFTNAVGGALWAADIEKAIQ